MSEQMYEGKSVQEALSRAAAELGVEVEGLEHEVVEEKTDDFWGLGETVFHVRVWAAGSEPEPEPELAVEAEPEPERWSAPEPEPAAEAAGSVHAEGAWEPAMSAEPAPPAAAEAVGEAIDAGDAFGPVEEAEGMEAAAVKLLDRIFETMSFDCAAEAEVDGGTLQVSISGDDNQYLLDGRGRGLSALELILNHAFRHRPEIGQKKIRVDAGDFRSQRDDEIRDLAYQVAHRAKETGEEQQTEPMNPYERRIVHLTVADDQEVTTRSLGAGFMKAVNIIPRSGGRR